MHWYLMAWKRWSDFSGRSQRAEYWTFGVVSYFVGIALLFFELSIDGPMILSMVYYLCSQFVGMAAGIRRLHDTGRSGWWWLVVLIPFGFLLALVFVLQDSEAGRNQYGPNPKTDPGLSRQALGTVFA